MRSVRRVSAACAATLQLAVVLTGCVSTQQIAARARLVSARMLASQTAIEVTRTNPDVSVGRLTVIRARTGAAVVVPLRNDASTALTDLPISVAIRTARGNMYLNRSANLDYFQTHVAVIGPHDSTDWVFTTGARVASRRAISVRWVSAASSEAGRRPATNRSVTARHRGRDRHEPLRDPQYDLQVYVLAIRSGRDVAAGKRGGHSPRVRRNHDAELHPARVRARSRAAADRTTDDLQLGAASMSATDSEQTFESPAVTAAAAAVTDYETCEQCASPMDSNQRYCVVCGTRRRHVYDPAARFLTDATSRSRSASRTTRGPGAGSPKRRSPGLGLALALALIPLAVAAGALIAGNGNDSNGKLLAALRAEKPMVVNVGGASTASGATTAAGTSGTGAAATPAARVTSSFAIQQGYAVELETLPGAVATEASVAAAESHARARGATAVGLLSQADFKIMPAPPAGDYADLLRPVPHERAGDLGARQAQARVRRRQGDRGPPGRQLRADPGAVHDLVRVRASGLRVQAERRPARHRRPGRQPGEQGDQRQLREIAAGPA